MFGHKHKYNKLRNKMEPNDMSFFQLTQKKYPLKKKNRNTTFFVTRLTKRTEIHRRKKLF